MSKDFYGLALLRANHGQIVHTPTGVVTQVVLFLIVAFKTLDISQCSVATHLRCHGIFSDSIITDFLLILTVKYF